MYNHLDELVQAIRARMADKSPQEIKDDPELVRLFALFSMYESALEEAKQYGWVGVGCITFAENRLRSYQQMPLIHESDLHRFDEYGHYGENNPPLK
jgi:hypothetical protein